MDEEGLIYVVWMFFREGMEGGGRFEGIWRGKIPSKPLIFNSPKLGEFGGGGGRDST